MPSPRRPGPILVAVLFYTAVFGPGIAAGDGALPAISDPVRVVAALQSFRVSSQSNGKSEAAWLNRLVSRLEREEGAHDPIRVVKRYVLERSVLGYSADEEDETRLQELASAAKVEFVVLGSLTRLADRYSLDVRLLRAERTTPMAHRVFEGEGVEGLARAFDRAAEAVRQWIAEPPVEPPPAAVSPVAAPVARPSVLGEAAGAADSPLQPVSAPKPFTVEPPEVPESAPRDEPGPEESAGPRVDPVAVALPRGQTRRTGAGAVVTDIRVVGNRRIEADAIRGRVVTRVGERYDPEIAREDVRRVFDLGFFRDVQVLASDRPEGKIVTFVVEENPIIRKVAVSGNTAISADDIREQLTLTVGSTIDYPLLLENRQRIEGLYQAKGYYLVSVNPAVEPLSDDAVIVSFDVVEGRKLRLVEINFVGNEYLSSGDLEGGLATKRWRWYSPVTHYVDNSGLYAEPVFFQDVDRIRRKYMDAGFIQVRIGEPEAEADEEGLKVTVRIQEGEQFRVGEIDVLGDATIDR
ncbi:MAG: POTRA domain-containing protein, partial [Myxococcota bacterium]